MINMRTGGEGVGAVGKGNGTVTGILAAVALMACCAVPLLAVTAAGAIAAAGGLAARFWPVTALGIAMVAWAGLKLGRLVRARSRALREHQDSDR